MIQRVLKRAEETVGYPMYPAYAGAPWLVVTSDALKGFLDHQPTMISRLGAPVVFTGQTVEEAIEQVRCWLKVPDAST